MSSKMAANVTALVSFVLAILWIIALVRPWTWLWTENGVVTFKVNLYSILVRKGTVGKVVTFFAAVKGQEATESLSKLFNHDFWLDEGVSQLCLPHVNAIWAWCDTWNMAKYGSYMFLFSGLVVAVLLVMGGAFTYYYAMVHATSTGRTLCVTCYIAAPSVASFGLLQYGLMTFSILTGQRQIIRTEAAYGFGFMAACALTMLTVIPLFLHFKYSKEDLFEQDDDYEFNANYGAAGTTPYPYNNGYPATYMQSNAMYGVPGNPGPPMYSAQGRMGAPMYSASGW